VVLSRLFFAIVEQGTSAFFNRHVSFRVTSSTNQLDIPKEFPRNGFVSETNVRNVECRTKRTASTILFVQKVIIRYTFGSQFTNTQAVYHCWAYDKDSCCYTTADRSEARSLSICLGSVLPAAPVHPRRRMKCDVSTHPPVVGELASPPLILLLARWNACSLGALIELCKLRNESWRGLSEDNNICVCPFSWTAKR
jgi:hypothetical protein